MAFATSSSLHLSSPYSGARVLTARPHRRRCLARSSRVRMSAAEAPAGKAVGLEAAWGEFAARMRASGESPPVAEWHALLDECAAAREPASKAIWVLSTMRDTGRAPTAATFERILKVCTLNEDRAAAFHLVELMWKDGILLGDVDLPEGMEKTLRTILPPEAFD